MKFKLGGHEKEIKARRMAKHPQVADFMREEGRKMKNKKRPVSKLYGFGDHPDPEEVAEREEQAYDEWKENGGR